MPSSDSFINKLASLGKKFIIMSNNDSQSKKERIRFLNRILNIEIQADNLLLPNDIVESFLLKNKIKSFDGLISNDFRNELIKKGFRFDSRNPEILIIGFDVNLNYNKIKRVVHHVNNGVNFILTHVDPLCPYKDNMELPDAGLIDGLIEKATGKKPAAIFGKPYREYLEYALNSNGFSKNDSVLVGDRLETDIKMANENGIISIWLYGQDSQLAKLKNSEYKPDICLKSIADLCELF